MLFAGMDGEVQDAPGHQREETEKLSYPGWEVEYRLKILRELKDYRKVFLFCAPRPCRSPLRTATNTAPRRPRL